MASRGRAHPRYALSDPCTACFYALRTIELLVAWVYDNDSQAELEAVMEQARTRVRRV